MSKERKIRIAPHTTSPGILKGHPDRPYHFTATEDLTMRTERFMIRNRTVNGWIVIDYVPPAPGAMRTVHGNVPRTRFTRWLRRKGIR